MPQKISVEPFRSVFKAVDKDLLRWFPGHMGRGLKQMQQKLRSVDCIIEVHDARIPISGRNSNFKYTISGIKPHILVLNKVDLIDTKSIPAINKSLQDEYQHVIFTNCKSQKCNGVKKLFPLAKDLIQRSDRFNRAGEEDFCVMIIGIPNVGKSSLINALRVHNTNKGNASHVGAKPGITRSVTTKVKISEKPLCYMLDTPGILTPNIPNTDVGLKLALCNTIENHLVGETIIADYLLYWLNKNRHLEYVDFFKLKEPMDNILEVLSAIGRQQKIMLKTRNSNNEYVYRPNLDQAAQYMIRSFRDGEIGKYLLDEDLV